MALIDDRVAYVGSQNPVDPRFFAGLRRRTMG
ncbi:MAG: hypothetical protein IPL00_19075 [Gammaproteobacteria bacterium]|nr:hypothetical protein [Gammaproteobacteria bacterium]